MENNALRRERSFRWQLGILALARVADFLTTSAFINKLGIGQEGNPIARAIIENAGLSGYALASIVTTTVGIAALCLMHNGRIRDTKNPFNFQALFVGNVELFGLVAFNAADTWMVVLNLVTLLPKN